jgi:glyoxylase-like metal-dependent hydrolase (beta-lactamase superfamily II)
MKICKTHHFGPVTGYELGFSPIGRPLMTVFFYHVDGLIIDTGQRHMRQAVFDILDRHRPDRILLTHHHEDHSGNAGAVRSRYEVDVMGHSLTAQKLAGPFKIRAYQHLVWGKSDPAPVLPAAEIRTRSGRLIPIHTPGHSRDHTVYLNTDQGWLFSGDLYLGDRIKYFLADENIHDQIVSLKTILDHDFDALFCCHHPSVKNGKARLEKKLAFLQDFCGAVHHLRQKGMAESDIIRQLDRHQERLVKWVTLGNACFANMVRSALKN